MRLVITSFLIGLCTAYSQDSTLVNIKEMPSVFAYEIRYATDKNFIGKKLYDCESCMLQEDVAKALVAANNYFCELGYKIKLYDCYRPLHIQKQMWEVMPRPTYVANPYTTGSIHNKGAAVDITLVTLEGCYVEMGSDYDFFGRASHIDNFDLAPKILKNREILQRGMKKFGFKTIRTEWWHFSYKKNTSYPTLDIPLDCSEKNK